MRLIDLSANNAHVNLLRVKQAGYAGCWHKASEGLHFQDRKFQVRRSAAGAISLRFGAYHFARPDLHPYDPVGEAKNFVSTVGRVKLSDLKLVLDYEEQHPAGKDAWWIREFNAYVKAKLGSWPMFYSYPGLIHEIRLSTPVGNGLWVAAYGVNDGKEHSVATPAPWKKWVVHQFTSVGVVPGVDGPCDVSYAPKLGALLAHPWVGRL